MDWDEQYLDRMSQRVMEADECASDDQAGERWRQWLMALRDVLKVESAHSVIDSIAAHGMDDVLRAWLARRP